MYYKPPYESTMDNKTRARIIGNTLQELRTKAGLSQKDICEYLPTTPQTYSGYENGRHEPSIETLVRLALLYNVSLDYLAGLWTRLDRDKEIFLYVDSVHENERLVDILETEAEEKELHKQRVAKGKAQMREDGQT